MGLLESWVPSANAAGAEFPLNNLPYGVFSTRDIPARCGVAIGDCVLDVTALEKNGVISLVKPVFNEPAWNCLMEAGQGAWADFRLQLTEILAAGATDQVGNAIHLHALADVNLHMPLRIAEYTDFYASRHHATNVGTMFRGAENALPPNWLHMPIGYNGRASSVVVSGTDVRRPWGQQKASNDGSPIFAPSARFDLELELGAIVGTASDGPVTVTQADQNIFGYVLLNDWSARDIQSWEYQPLGPFQSKATATSISPWIVTQAALEPFRCPTPAREFPLLEHLKDAGPMLYNIDVVATLAPAGKKATTITRTNYDQMYYSAAQQLAHHTTSGCPMRVGDLLGSGTISGDRQGERGSLLELSWGGKHPVKLDTGETRSFLEDGDTICLGGVAHGDGYDIGFGSCAGTVLPAITNPYNR